MTRRGFHTQGIMCENACIGKKFACASGVSAGLFFYQPVQGKGAHFSRGLKGLQGFRGPRGSDVKMLAFKTKKMHVQAQVQLCCFQARYAMHKCASLILCSGEFNGFRRPR